MRLASVDLEGKEYISVPRLRGLDERADPLLEQDEPQGQPERQLGRQPQQQLRCSGGQGLLERILRGCGYRILLVFEGLNPATKHAAYLVQA